MSYVERRNGRYRARYRDPLGRVTSTTFDRKADAQRFLAEMETEKARKSWIDPRHADLPLASGPLSSWRWPAGCLRALRRPTEGI
jgi:hypothetical protein